MAHKGFEVRPVKRYDGAQYPMQREGQIVLPETPETPSRPAWLSITTLLVVLLVTLGLIACVNDDRIRFDEKDPVPTDGDNDGDDSVGLPCGDTWEPVCEDADTVVLCVNGVTFAMACEDVCENDYGTPTNTGCDAAFADNSCGCEYDITDGDIAGCYPGDVVCIDDSTFQVCSDDYYTWETVDCYSYCEENFGYLYVPGVCDASQTDNICGCFEDVTDGIQSVCSVGEMYCSDEKTLEICIDDYTGYEPRDCEQYCQETAPDDPGAYGYSLGCDAANAENPCGCEYDILDGDVASCTPGEFVCADDYTLNVCQDDGYSWAAVDCWDRCLEQFGPDYYPVACNIENADNPCGCEYGIVDGGMVECYVGDQQCDEATGNLMECVPYDPETEPVAGEPGTYRSVSCNDWCQERYGYEYYAQYGVCMPDDPRGDGELCVCEYGLTDGIAAECTPGDVECLPDGSINRCADYYWVYENCTDLCRAQDPAFVSQGCDASAADPCLCGPEEEPEDGK
ncbi:MAG: hypothetical protein C4523_01485 [Myxococcales bacterium]|nr:MAG: hypothetical protein C4523_01485 [Myxococcales bacterium]